jgi:hypothetical protein
MQYPAEGLSQTQLVKIKENKKYADPAESTDPSTVLSTHGTSHSSDVKVSVVHPYSYNIPTYSDACLDVHCMTSAKTHPIEKGM